MANIEVDPILVRKALEDLGINAPVQAAYRDEDGALVIRTREGTHTLPMAASGRASTLPDREDALCQSAVSAGIDGQSPPGRNCQGEGGAPSPDDFTAIDGVGSKTAEKLHAKGLFTYGDLRQWLARRSRAVDEDDEIRDYTVEKIRDWLAERSV